MVADNEQYFIRQTLTMPAQIVNSVELCKVTDKPTPPFKTTTTAHPRDSFFSGKLTGFPLRDHSL